MHGGRARGGGELGLLPLPRQLPIARALDAQRLLPTRECLGRQLMLLLMLMLILMMMLRGRRVWRFIRGIVVFVLCVRRQTRRRLRARLLSLLKRRPLFEQCVHCGALRLRRFARGKGGRHCRTRCRCRCGRRCGCRKLRKSTGSSSQ